MLNVTHSLALPLLSRLSWGFTGQLPVAVIAACVVYLSAWLTGPDSPVNSPDTEIFPVTQTTTDESEYTD